MRVAPPYANRRTNLCIQRSLVSSVEDHSDRRPTSSRSLACHLKDIVGVVGS